MCGPITYMYLQVVSEEMAKLRTIQTSSINPLSL